MSSPYADLKTLRVRAQDGVARVVIDHPPVNLMDLSMTADLARLVDALEGDSAVRVVVFQSALPGFFIAHADVAMILDIPRREAPLRPTELSPFHRMLERLRTLPQATIAQIEGRAGGGGSELALSLDLRFAARGRAVLCQPEVALGILPGAGGTQRLARLSGRGRALEIVLGCDDFDADTAERYGWVNRALDPGEIGPFVDRLAARIASYPRDAIAAAKRALDEALPSPEPGLLEETHAFNRLMATDSPRPLMRRFLEAGGQTPEGERDLQRVLEALSKG